MDARPQIVQTPPTPAWGEEAFRVPVHVERRGVVARPFPPDTCDEESPITFEPSPRLSEWIQDTFILGSGPLANEDHAHLIDASIGALWTNAINISKQRQVMATAEIPNAMAGGWRRARFDFQITQWFGTAPDFVLTFSAPDCARMDDRAFCALVEHELYHCAQAEDRYGGPKFTQDGAPVFAIRGHDSEEFVGVMRRYGRNGVSKGTRDLVDAAIRAPLMDGPAIELACGTCG